MNFVRKHLQLHEFCLQTLTTAWILPATLTTDEFCPQHLQLHEFCPQTLTTAWILSANTYNCMNFAFKHLQLLGYCPQTLTTALILSANTYNCMNYVGKHLQLHEFCPQNLKNAWTMPANSYNWILSENTHNCTVPKHSESPYKSRGWRLEVLCLVNLVQKQDITLHPLLPWQARFLCGDLDFWGGQCAWLFTEQ